MKQICHQIATRFSQHFPYELSRYGISRQSQVPAWSRTFRETVHYSELVKFNGEAKWILRRPLRERPSAESCPMRLKIRARDCLFFL